MTSSTTIKVTPTSRGNFSKLRKYKTGGITKYEEPAVPLWYSLRYSLNSALNGWNQNLSSALAGASIYGDGASNLHGNAGDLTYAYKSNAAYTGNREAIGLDLNTWYKLYKLLYPLATPEKAVEAYNTAAAQIRAYLTRAHTYGDTDARTTNRLFKNMFSSRTIKNDGEDKSKDDAFIGYLEDLEHKYGSSSFLRRMDNYEKEYDKLTDKEKALRQYVLGEGNSKFVVYKKANGDLGLLSNASDTNDDLINWEALINNIPEEKKDSKGQFNPLKDWNTAWLWNAALLGNTLKTNLQILDTISLMKMHRPLAPKVHGLWNGDYTYQKAIEDLKAKNNLLGNLMMQNSSDLTLGMLGALAANEQNNLLAINGAQHQAAKYLDEMTKAVAREDQTSLYNTQAYNTGQKEADAYINNLLIAKGEAIGKNALAKEENLIANRIDTTAFNLDNWLNQRDQYNSDLDLYSLELQQNWNLKLIDSEKLTNDPIFKFYYNKYFGTNANGLVILKGSPEWGVDFVEWANENGGITEENFARFIQDPKLWIDSDTGESTDYSKHFAPIISLHEIAFAKTTENYRKNLKGLDLYISKLKKRAPLKFSGQLPYWYYNTLNSSANLFLVPDYQPVSAKEGGSLTKKDRFLLYLEYNLKATDTNRDRVLKYTKNSQDMFKRDLDSLDRETLLLLRTIFK